MHNSSMLKSLPQFRKLGNNIFSNNDQFYLGLLIEQERVFKVIF